MVERAFILNSSSLLKPHYCGWRVSGHDVKDGSYLSMHVQGEALAEYRRFMALKETVDDLKYNHEATTSRGGILIFEMNENPDAKARTREAYPFYDAVHFRADNYFDVAINLTEFPHALPWDEENGNSSSMIKGMLVEGPNAGKLVEIICPRLAFRDCADFTHHRPNSSIDCHNGLYPRNDLDIALFPNQPVAVTGCMLSDDGQYISTGCIVPRPFNALGLITHYSDLKGRQMDVEFATGPLAGRTVPFHASGHTDEQPDDIRAGDKLKFENIRFWNGKMYCLDFTHAPRG